MVPTKAASATNSVIPSPLPKPRSKLLDEAKSLALKMGGPRSSIRRFAVVGQFCEMVSASVNRQACTHLTATTTRNTAIERLLRKGQLASSNHSYNPKVSEMVGGTTTFGAFFSRGVDTTLGPVTNDSGRVFISKEQNHHLIHSKYSQPRS